MAERYTDLARGLNSEIGRKHWEAIRASGYAAQKNIIS
ncbi:MAG: hypothetical protein CG443_839 [Methanosaeta sp. ASP1-1]|nr:MAG: hypothetical protein CG443_839 [Methanosaeta sp. ASP1-1]